MSSKIDCLLELLLILKRYTYNIKNFKRNKPNCYDSRARQMQIDERDLEDILSEIKSTFKLDKPIDYHDES